MKNLLTATLLLFVSICFGQYNYGLEVEQHDSKIEGKLDLQDPLSSNVYIGEEAGTKHIFGNGTTFLGKFAGRNFESGSRNTFLGSASALMFANGDDNVFVGSDTGTAIFKSSNNNIFIGAASGVVGQDVSNNIVLGNNVSFLYSDTGAGRTNDMLIIDNNNNLTNPNPNPLVYGEFENKKLGINWEIFENGNYDPLPATLSINGTLNISETAKLEPQATVPSCATGDMGTMYVDTAGVLYFCNGTAWKTVQLN